MKQKRNWSIFFSSVFFVLGFSFVFSLLGVLLQGVLSDVSVEVQKWLGRIGGIVIIFFGLYLVGLIKPKFLQKEYKFEVKRRFRSKYLTAFVFGSAFAIGWTPCVGAILGAILALAVAEPGGAFLLLMSYSLGLGVPFLLVGLFTEKAQKLISKYGKTLRYLNYIFGAVLILLGVFIFTNNLSLIANLSFASNFLTELNFGGFDYSGSLNLIIAFVAGLASFLSPCVLPLIPAFLAYLGSTINPRENKNE
jgi:cytochrome c-type biogenesis protein